VAHHPMYSTVQYFFLRWVGADVRSFLPFPCALGGRRRRTSWPRWTRTCGKMLLTRTPPPEVQGVRVWPRAIPQFLVGHGETLERARRGSRGGAGRGVPGGNYVAGVALGRCVEGGARAQKRWQVSWLLSPWRPLLRLVRPRATGGRQLLLCTVLYRNSTVLCCAVLVVAQGVTARLLVGDIRWASSPLLSMLVFIKSSCLRQAGRIARTVLACVLPLQSTIQWLEYSNCTVNPSSYSTLSFPYQRAMRTANHILIYCTVQYCTVWKWCVHCKALTTQTCGTAQYNWGCSSLAQYSFSCCASVQPISHALCPQHCVVRAKKRKSLLAS